MRRTTVTPQISVAGSAISDEIAEMTIQWRGIADIGPLTGLEQRALSFARLHAVSSGQAPTVLFVHGGFHGSWCWGPAISALAAQGLTCAAIDLRGHGGLVQDPSFIAQGVEAMTADVLEALRHLARDFFLVGHSLGALIAMAAATRSASRGLILLAPATPAGIPGGQALPRFPEQHAIQVPGEDRVRKWFLSGASDEDVGAYLSLLCPESPRLLNECFHEGVRIPAAALPCPVLCISGGKDDSPLHRRAQDAAVASAYGAELRTVAASGHCMMLDDGWRETARHIHDWIGAVPSVT